MLAAIKASKDCVCFPTCHSCQKPGSSARSAPVSYYGSVARRKCPALSSSGAATGCSWCGRETHSGTCPGVTSTLRSPVLAAGVESPAHVSCDPCFAAWPATHAGCPLRDPWRPGAHQSAAKGPRLGRPRLQPAAATRNTRSQNIHA